MMWDLGSLDVIKWIMNAIIWHVHTLPHLYFQSLKCYWEINYGCKCNI